MQQLLVRKIDELFGIDSRSLALMRVGFSLIVLYDFFFERLIHLTVHYTESGVYPSIASTNGVPEDLTLSGIHWINPWHLLFLLRDIFPPLPLVIICVGIFGALLLLLGWRTRIASVVVWVSVLAMQMLNPVVLQGADVLLRVCLFIGMFLPWGEVYSVDRALTLGVAPRERICSGWTMAFLLQISFMYLFASMEKSAPEWTVYGTAVYYALFIDQFSTPIGEFIRQFPTLMMLLTFGVKTLQGSVFFLLFTPVMTVPLRTLGMLALMLMHLSFALCLNLGLFSWISITALTAFLPTRFWVWMKKRTERTFGNLTIYYDEHCGFCKKSCYLIRTFALLPKTGIRPAQTNEAILGIMREKDSWVVVDRHGAHTTTYGAGISIAKASPFFFIFVPLLEMAWARKIGERVYRFIANHRRLMCLPALQPKKLSDVLHRVLTVVSTLLACCYISAVLFWNYAGYAGVRGGTVIMPAQYNNIMWKLGLVQSWRLFSPYPLKDDGWYAVAGTLTNGDKVNLFDPSLPIPTREKPANVSVLYPDDRTRTFMMNIVRDGYRDIRPYYLNYLCNDWNRHHAGAEKLKHVTLTFMLEKTLPDYQKADIVPTLLGEKECDAG